MTEPAIPDNSGAAPTPPLEEQGVDGDVALSGNLDELIEQGEEVLPLPPLTPGAEKLPPGVKVSDYLRPATEQRHGGDEHPVFQLPGGGEDEPEGASPTMHTREEETHRDFREKIGGVVAQSLAEWEEHRVEKAKKYLADVSLIADDIVLVVENLVKAFKHKGFTDERAYELAKLVIEKKLQPFL